MRKYALAFVASVFAFVAGCATTTDDKSAEPRQEKVYRTGSNIPVRDSGSPSSTQSFDPASQPMGPRGMPSTGGGR
jgi:hypothetical protein